MAQKRSHVIALMRGAFRRGQSATSFLWDMKQKGLSYRRTDMLADWRSINELEVKEGLMRYVRKNYYPAIKEMAASHWKWETEYTYKLRVQSRITPDAPIKERLVTIPSDVPLTPEIAEELAWEMIKEQSPKLVSQVERITPWTAIHRIQ